MFFSGEHSAVTYTQISENIVFIILIIIIEIITIVLKMKFLIIPIYFRQSTLKGPWPVVVWPHCIRLLYTLFCYTMEAQ